MILLNQIKIKNSGVTLLEVIMVIAIIGILSVIVIRPFTAEKRATDLRGVTLDAMSLIRQSQSKTLFSENSSAYGVHLQSDKLVLFTGTSYNSNAVDNINLTLPTNFSIGSVSLNGGGSEILFSRLTGETTNYGTFNISYSSGTPNATITVSQTGLTSSNL